jgi:hypothetical protein
MRIFEATSKFKEIKENQTTRDEPLSRDETHGRICREALKGPAKGADALKSLNVRRS